MGKVSGTGVYKGVSPKDALSNAQAEWFEDFDFVSSYSHENEAYSVSLGSNRNNGQLKLPKKVTEKSINAVKSELRKTHADTNEADYYEVGQSGWVLVEAEKDGNKKRGTKFTITTKRPRSFSSYDKLSYQTFTSKTDAVKEAMKIKVKLENINRPVYVMNEKQEIVSTIYLEKHYSEKKPTKKPNDKRNVLPVFTYVLNFCCHVG